MIEVFIDSLWDAVVDSLKVIPVLFLAYLLVSFLSHDHSHKFSKFLSKNKQTSVIYASFLGCVPQCGFSSVMSDLYSKRKVSLGTLIAVFVATSDEAIPIMLTNKDAIVDMLLLIAIKLVIAIVAGYLIDLCVCLHSKIHHKKHVEFTADEVESSHVHYEHDHHFCGHIHTDECEDLTDKHCCADNIFLDAYHHTFEIVIYIFIATFVLNLLLGYADFAGVDIVSKVLTDNAYVQVLVASVIGLVPNCAASVLLVELFLAGSLNLAALVAGLTSCAGVGVIILWTKNHKHPLKNLGILVLQFFVGVASGMLLTLFL